MKTPEERVSFDRTRINAMLVLLERMAAGDTGVQLPLSENRDELDAIAHAVNVLADELRWASAQMAEEERRANSARRGSPASTPREA